MCNAAAKPVQRHERKCAPFCGRPAAFADLEKRQTPRFLVGPRGPRLSDFCASTDDHRPSKKRHRGQIWSFSCSFSLYRWEIFQATGRSQEALPEQRCGGMRKDELNPKERDLPEAKKGQRQRRTFLQRLLLLPAPAGIRDQSQGTTCSSLQSGRDLAWPEPAPSLGVKEAFRSPAEIERLYSARLAMQQCMRARADGGRPSKLPKPLSAGVTAKFASPIRRLWSEALLVLIRVRRFLAHNDPIPFHRPFLDSVVTNASVEESPVGRHLPPMLPTGVFHAGPDA